MFKFNHPQKNPIFDYYAPTNDEFIGLLSIPHSGEEIPEEFQKYLSQDERAYKEDVDFKVNELVDIQALQAAGVGVLVAHVHRICVDLNRAESNCIMFWKNNTQGKALIIKDPTPEEETYFINKYHKPYFEMLKAALQNLEATKKGLVSMVDLHSMPSKPTEYHMKQNPNQKMTRADFCVSDRKGKTCEKDFIDFFANSLKQDTGYTSVLNDPYVGGYITEYVDGFRTNNIQIEINRSIYMDETSKELISEKVARLKPILTQTLIEGFKKFNS